MELQDCLTISTDARLSRDSFQLSEVLSSIEYIFLESPKDHLIGEITNMVIYDDKFFILDNRHTQSIFIFSVEGKFIFELNKRGPGPAEYPKINDFTIDYDNNYIIVLSGLNLLAYDFQGNWISSTQIDIYANDFSYLGNGFYAFYGDFNNNRKYEEEGKQPNLFILKDNKVIHLGLYFPASVEVSALLTNPFPFSSEGESTLSLIEAYNDTIYDITQDELSPKYHIDFVHKKKDEDFFSLLYSPALTYEVLHSYEITHDICNLNGFSETQNCIFFAYRNKTNYHFAFYDKTSNHLVDASMDYKNISSIIYPVINDIDGIKFSPPLFSDKNYFYSNLDVYDLKKARDKITDPFLSKQINEVSEFDNPIIVKMTPKKF